MASERLCVCCKNWYLTYEGDYSDLTPGAGAETGCYVLPWYLSISGHGDIEGDFRKRIELAVDCEHFKPTIAEEVQDGSD